MLFLFWSYLFFKLVWEDIYQNVPKIVYKLYDMDAIERGR